MCVMATASAQVYKRTGPDGQVYFSDRPGPDAVQIEVEPAQAISMPQSPQQTSTARQHEGASSAYTELAIVSPSNDQAIRANDGNIRVNLSLQPGLMAGHAIILNVDGEDGKQTKSTASLSIDLSNLSRGRHTVEAAVVDGKGNVLKQSAPISFNVLRAAVGGG